MTTERRPVCHRCAQIKQACDGNLPCSRCTRLSLPCRPRGAPDGVSAFPGAQEEDELVNAPKARIRRVQTGCIMCKQRKKKCDEIKPKCGDCRRLCLECHWPPERARDKMAGSKTAGKAPTRESIQQPSPPHVQHSQHSQPSRYQKPSQYQPNHSPATPVASMSSMSSMPSSTPTLATPASSAAPFGQISIRQHSPVMSSPISVKHESFSKNSDDVEEINDQSGPGQMITYDNMVSWEPPSMSSPPWYEIISPVSNGSPDPMDARGLSLYVPQLLPQLQSPHDRALLNHYSTIVSPLLSRRSSSSSNPYINYLLPMAHSNELVLHCILALSGNHWRKMQPHMGNRGLLHQSQATQSLAHLLPSVDTTSADIALVSSLLLCMTELFDGTSEGWQLHLKGAKRLLAALKQQHGDLSSGQYKFLLRLSRFLDSAATVSTCRPPMMEDEVKEAAMFENMTPNADADDSAVYGIPKELFHLVDAINSLADKRKNRVDAASEATFRHEASQVEERLDRWSFEYGGLNRAVSTLAPADEDALHATMAFEHALRLRLHQIIEGYALTDPKVPHAVEGILDCVQKIRYGSPLEPCLLFPLVMAGGACYRLEQRAVIQDRLMVMERTCGFGYVYNARDLVERVWTRRDQTEGTGAIVNWARIRYEEMHGLVVF